ncbi:MAG: DUF4153 domain-containing protein [Syntrophomonadaceae bacterium]|jgi:hypothetical protein|nr:DUF4153 domain-containing protein [Syntrophomonadaceae bacterium]
MNTLLANIRSALLSLFEAVSRFPLTVVSLIGATILLCYMISLHKPPDLIIQKLAYTFLLGSFLGITAQFACERFDKLHKKRALVYLISTLLIVGYYLILMPAQGISNEVVVRTFVAVAAMFCAFIWVPSFKSQADFNEIALVHFKSALISILYSAVLTAGWSSIIAAVDTLLFSVNQDIYAYSMVIIWVLFATLYYLSLLPRFNSEKAEDQEFACYSAQYPRFLEILISYIAIPLVAIFTLVLAAYFIKILVTLKWPSGQLGGMVLAYSASGLIIYILASLSNNRFAVLYRLIFPRVLIPVVIMQLISVGIRLNAYGITESRYYITLFGVFSLLCGIMLSFMPVSKNGRIALLAAGFAILSVVPPVDAFSLSRHSQITRLENMLQAEGILHEGKITPKADVSMNLRLETTNILNYLEAHDYDHYLTWLPQDFNAHKDMKSVFGFEPAYPGMDRGFRYFYAALDAQQPVDISGFDIMVRANSHNRETEQTAEIDFTVQGEPYKFLLQRLSNKEVRVAVQNAAGEELISTGLYDFAQTIAEFGNESKHTLPPENMSLEVENNGYKLRVLLENININEDDSVYAGVDYGLMLMFGVPGDDA